MTHPLDLCARCHRHVERTRELCPFCSAPSEAAAQPRSHAVAVARVARVAALSLTAAATLPDCDAGTAPPYGSPPLTQPDAQGCTALGCAAPLTVTFDRASGWTAGAYRVVASTSTGATQTCSLSLPLNCSTSPRCDGPGDWRVTTSGCALDASQHAITGIEFLTAPGHVVVNLFQDERPVGSGEFTAEYTASRPNGPNCEPLCRNAPTVHLTVGR